MPGSMNTMLGKGAVLAYSTTFPGPGTYTPLTKVVSISPNVSVGETEDVTLDSTFEDYLPTLPSGEANFTMRFRPGDAGVKIVLGWALVPTTVHWKLTFSDGSALTWDGFVKGFNVTTENREKVDAEVPMRIRTLPVFVEAA